MTDQQILAYLPLITQPATLAVLIVGFVYNNSRLTNIQDAMRDLGSEIRVSVGDLRGSIGDLRSSMNDMRDMLRAEMRVLQTSMDKNQSELLGKFAELDTRVSRIEQRFH